MSEARDMAVANTILAQLGGRRFIGMTGARNFVGTSDSLIFMLPRGAKNGINKVVVRLNAGDTYDVDFYHMARNAARFEPPVSSHTDIYCDVLADVFARVTGLAVSL